jgi:hypothetical protein
MYRENLMEHTVTMLLSSSNLNWTATPSYLINPTKKIKSPKQKLTTTFSTPLENPNSRIKSHPSLMPLTPQKNNPPLNSSSSLKTMW